MSLTSPPSATKPSNVNVNNTTPIKHHILGNGLAATIHLQPGSIIISSNSPYHILVENSALDKVCSWCFLSSPSLKRCSSCKTSRYCSPTCQKRDWGTGEHKFECAILKGFGEGRTLPTPVRAVIQLLLRGGKGEDGEWRNLESHEGRFRRNRGRWEDIVLQARGVMGFSGLGMSEERLGDAVGLLCRMKTNSFRATSPDGTPIGLLLDPVFALVNHSCAPNAELECDGRHIRLRALKEIQAGEQIFICYIDENEDLETRRQMLEERYFFKCACERCVEEGKRNGGDPP